MIRKIFDLGIVVAVLLMLNTGLLYLCNADGEDASGIQERLAAAVESQADAEVSVKDPDEGEGDTKGEDNSGDSSDMESGSRTEGKMIRILLKTDGYRGICHPRVTLQAKSGLTVTYGDNSEAIEEKLTLAPDDTRFKDGVITVKSSSDGKVKITSLNRGCGHPSYQGVLYLYSTAEGIVIVNELLLEKYLYGVVPSEMPSSFEKEALKAQAVCARSFAYMHLDSYAYEDYKANMDDSTSFQVYANSDYAKSAKEAVKETAGQMIWYKDKIIQAYYYSTSCGKTASAAVWGADMKKKCSYLESVSVSDGKEDYEKDLPWYHWSARISGGLLSDLLSQYAGKDLGTIQTVEITKRDNGGAAITMKVCGGKGNLTVKTENKIRRALGGSGYKIQKNDGSYSDSTELLPSAFIDIAKDGNDFMITGGGFGHGIGMSQNGANEMAKCGADYKAILGKFYSGVEVY